MMLKLKSSFLLIILSIIFYSCEKEYSLEGNLAGGTAVYTLDGASGICTNASVTGTYKEGTALDATNIVTISVDVTTPGTYAIATTTLKGISFSGSGSFSVTGPQTISLTGTGIPDTPGTVSFTPGVNGCAFPVTITSGGSSGGTSVFTYDGNSGNCTGFTPGGTYAAGTALGAGNFASVSVNVTTLGTYAVSTNTVNGITFSANGTFTATGTQVIQLNGSGTPIVGGTFDFTPGANGCTFSITVTGSSSGSAVFTYDGGTGICTTAFPSGTFTSGNVLTASNIVIVDVNVTATGTYLITTPLVNGFSFSGSGSFATIGINSVTLTGTGTPATEGDFNFTLSNNGCSFPITVFAGTPSTDFLRCTIDGIDRTFNLNISSVIPDPALVAISGDETSASVTPSFQISLAKSPAVTIGNYDRFSLTNTSTYCGIAYSDGVAATGWATGILQSGGFSVNVTSYAGNRIEGTFSGTLYDNDGSGTVTKAITAGQFSVPY
ncbi:MAG: hypothetical protein ABI760_00530 [Ferruginibacter sp.]